MSPAPRWSPWSAPLALLLAFTMAIVATAIPVGISKAATGDTDTPGAQLVATALQDICFVAAAIILAATRGRPTPEQFGLRRVPWRLAAKWVAGAYVGFIVFAQVWLTLVDEKATDDKTLDTLGVDRSTAALLGAMFVVCVMAPIAEEFLFRGYIFTALRNWSGPLAAAAMTGVLFGVIHLDPDRPAAFLLPLAFLGFLLCVVYWRTGSLYPCFALHCINNSIAFGATEKWTWQIPLLAVGALACVAAIVLGAQRLAGAGRASPAAAS